MRCAVRVGFWLQAEIEAREKYWEAVQKEVDYIAIGCRHPQTPEKTELPLRLDLHTNTASGRLKYHVPVSVRK